MAYQSLWASKRQAILDVAERMKAQHPAAWEEVKVPGQPSRTFISLVAAECQKTISADIGCNLKRGGPDVSLDVLAMPNSSGARDATGTFHGLELVDIIGGAEGGSSNPEPQLVWGDVTQKTIDAGVPGGWVQSAGTTPGPVPSPIQPYPDESPDGGWWGQVFDVEAAKRYKAAGRVYPDPGDPRSLRWCGRVAYDIRDGLTKEASLEKHMKELDQQLGIS